MCRRSKQSDDGFPVAYFSGLRHRQSVGKRTPFDAKDFMLFGSLRHRRKSPRQVEMNDFSEHPRRTYVVAERFPMRGGHAGFFDELAACRIERRFFVVDFPRGQFPNPSTRGMAKLMQQANASLVVDRHDGGAARMMRDFEVDASAIG